MNINAMFLCTILTIIGSIAIFITFLKGIWEIHISINKQNEILEEQNEILLKFLEEHDKTN